MPDGIFAPLGRSDFAGSAWVSTYSLLARDADGRALGLAVQSHYFSVGSVVPWAQAGVGLVATQALAEPSYGPLGLAELEKGARPQKALSGLVEADPGRDWRQVALLDARGEAAVHTGSRCIAAAGHRVGRGCVGLGNMLASEAVWERLVTAFEEAPGDLAERLLAGLEGAESAGGDARGRQSAALLIVSDEAPSRPGTGRTLDLRVEDHPEPLVELRRLLGIARAARHGRSAAAAAAAGDVAVAERELARAESIQPDNPEHAFWVAVSLANAGRDREALDRMQQLLLRSPRWSVLLARLPRAGLLRPESRLAEVLADRGHDR